MFWNSGKLTNTVNCTFLYMILLSFLFSCGAAAQGGPWPLHSWGFWITHNDASQSVGLLWRSDRLVAETSTRQQTNIHAPGGNFFIVLICLRGFFRHNRAPYPPTRLACGRKTQSETVRVLVKSWSRWMRLGLFSQVGAPSYSYHPVHFLGLGTTSCGLPLYGPVPSSIVVATNTWCRVLWGNSRHSYARSAMITSSIRIVSGSPLGRVTSGLVVGLVGTSQIGICTHRIRTHDLSRRAAAELRLRAFAHTHRQNRSRVRLRRRMQCK